jgi:hypothetical protein
MGINDFGGANDPLANPPLGGPNGWAAAVVEAIEGLQQQHVIRSTRPNTTDHLVEVFDGSAWIPMHYDSGYREMSAAAQAEVGDTATVHALTLQRIGTVVYMTFAVSMLVDAPGNTLRLLPFGSLGGFTPAIPPNGDMSPAVGYQDSLIVSATSTTALLLLRSDMMGLYGSALTTGSDWRGTAVYRVDPAIPSSLPGTALAPAPAPPPDQP